jgi:hypothetical protein
MLRFLKYTLLFITGAVLYYAVEVAFRGYSFFFYGGMWRNMLHIM